MKDLLHECSKNTGCNEQTVENKAFFQESSKLRSGLKSSPIGLLESIQVQVGCMYLSDLHIPYNLPLVQSALRKIEPDSYPLREWNDAVCYITGQELHFESQRDAAKYLMNWNC